jgi:hypothetical protein
MANFLEGVSYGVLNDILSEFHSNEGYALPSRYEVLLYPPPAGRGKSLGSLFANLGSSNKESKSVSLRCEKCQLPGTTISSSPDTNIYGPTREIAESVLFAGSTTMDFQASSDLRERVFFEKWQQKCYNPETWNIGYYSDYIGSIDVYLLDVNNQRRFGIKLHEVWPKTIAATDVSGAKASDIIKISVTFQFRKMTTLDSDNQPPSLADKIAQTVNNAVERNVTRNIPAVLRKLPW